MPREQPPHGGGETSFDARFVARVFAVFVSVIVVLALLIVFGPRPSKRLADEAEYRQTPHLVAAAGGAQLWKAYDAEASRWVYFATGGASWASRNSRDVVVEDVPTKMRDAGDPP